MIDIDKQIFILYGTDHGLISEYVQSIKTQWIRDITSYIEITNANLAKNPDMLMAESLTISLLDQHKLLYIYNPNLTSIKIIQKWVEQHQSQSKLLLIFHETISTSIQKLWIKHQSCQIIKCYPYTKYKQKEKIAELFKVVQQPIQEQALSLLNSLLENNYHITKSEVDKLITYHLPKTQPISKQEIQDCIINNQITTLDSILDQYFISTDSNTILLLQDNLIEYNPIIIINTVLQHLLKLYTVISKASCPESYKEQMLSLKPPLHFSRYHNFITQLSYWSLPKINHAIHKLIQIDKLIIQGVPPRELCYKLLYDLRSR